MNRDTPDLIETMRVQANGCMPLLDRHLARLRASSTVLGYSYDETMVRHALRVAAKPADGAVRLRLLLHADGRHTLQAGALPALSGPQGVCLWPDRLASAEPLLRHKTTWRPWYDGIGAWLASRQGVFDALLINERGELCEGSRTNVYLLLDGNWYTPPVACGCLPGVQRAALLDEGKARERVLHLDDLERAAGVRVSNALRGWMDVVLHPDAPTSG